MGTIPRYIELPNGDTVSEGDKFHIENECTSLLPPPQKEGSVMEVGYRSGAIAR